MMNFLEVLRDAMQLIRTSTTENPTKRSAAQRLASKRLNDWYHKERRTQEDYHQLLRLTKFYRPYVEADEQTKSEIARILYEMERRFRHRNEPIYVHYDEGTKLYTIEEAPVRP